MDKLARLRFFVFSIVLLLICVSCWEQRDVITIKMDGTVSFNSEVVVTEEGLSFDDIDELSAEFVERLMSAGWKVSKKWVSKSFPYKLSFSGTGNLKNVSEETDFYEMKRIDGNTYKIKFFTPDSEGGRSSRSVVFKQSLIGENATVYDLTGQSVSEIPNVFSDREYIIKLDGTQSTALSSAQDALLKGIKERDFRTVHEALIAGVEANIKFVSPQFNNIPTPALLFATLNGSVDIVELLITNGADVNATVKVEEGVFLTSLLLAEGFGHQEIIRMLSDAGAIPLDSKQRTLANNMRNSQKRGRTVADIRSLGTALGSFQVDHKKFPVQHSETSLNLSLIPREYYGGPLRDAWGTPFRYWSDGGKYRVTSYGSDRKLGGEGLDADIVFENRSFVAPPELVR